MSIDDLQIPKVEPIEPFAYNHNYMRPVYLTYSNIVEKNELGQGVVNALTSDPRVTNLSGNIISQGHIGHSFDVKTLAMWFIWCANELGEEAAKGHLHDYLNSEEIEVSNTIWILGIEVDKPIELMDGYIIQPVKGMPFSSEKVLFLQGNFSNMFPYTLQPVAAITKTCLVKKILRIENPSEDKDPFRDFRKVCRKLYDISMLLNLLNNVSCLPSFSTSYTNIGTPFGPFGAGDGSPGNYDIIGNSLTKISSEDRVTINALIKSYESFDNLEKARVFRILNRLSQAKCRTKIEDKILDLGITLEMLLLQDNLNNDQLSLSFRLRGSWLIGDSPEDRAVIYSKLRDIYNYRSQVAHSGVLCKGDHAKVSAVRDAFPEYQSCAEKFFRKIIQYGKPDWNKVILGAV